MEDTKINFSRPILSVRRNQSKLANSQKDTRRKNESSVPALIPCLSYKSDMHSGPLRDPGSVPFVWEQSPGRPKDERQPQKYPIVPKPPPGRIAKPNKQYLDNTTPNSNVTKGHSKESFGSSIESGSRDDDHDSHGDVFLDAFDTPPHNEYFMPEVPQNDARKQVIKEKPREVKKEMTWEIGKPQLTYGPNFLQLNGDDNEDSESDYDEHENMSFKGCGLLSHFCLKGSIGLVNPVPGLSVRSRMPVSSANKNRKTRATSASANSQHTKVAAFEHKSPVKHQKGETVLKNESTDVTDQKLSRKLEGSGLYDRLQGCGNLNNFLESSPTNVSERKDGNLQTKGLVSFKELLAYEKENEEDSQSPMVEKILYVDTIHKVESAESDMKENDQGIFDISRVPTESFKSILLADKVKDDKETITQTGFCKYPKVDRKVKASRKSELELPAPPPLPKSPSDSWLWRTLPSMSSKGASVRSNPKYPSNTTSTLDKDVQLGYPQGLLLPIPET